VLLAAGVFFSCKSTPKTTSEAVVAETPAEETAAVSEEKPEVSDAGIITESAAVPPMPSEADIAGLERRKQEYAELGMILAEIRAKRQEIINAGFDDADRQAFDEADEMLKRAEEVYDAGFEAFNENAMSDARLALSGFNAIVDAVWMAKTDALRVNSSEKQQEALKLRADTAVKDKYNFATELHNKGTAAFRGKDYFVAIDFFERSIPAFEETIGIAAEKKEKAELALKNAEEKILESEKIVEDAIKFLGDSIDQKGDVL
jgi:tetratricopeptide (TPR) repeat protein